MYEDKKLKLNINWPSLLIKLGILLLVAFIVCFIIFRPKKDNTFISLENNITTVKEAAINYYKNNLNLKEIGDYEKLSLEKLIAEDLIEEQTDNEGNSCDTKKSYSYLTKTRDDEFVLKINLVCGDNKESKTFNLTTKDLTVVANKEELKEEFENELEEEILVEEEVTEESEIIEENTEIAENDNKDNDSNKQHIDFNNDELIADLHSPNNNKVIKYKHVSYGEWVEGTKYGEAIENSTKVVHYYNYCLNNNCVIDRLENAVNYENYTATYSHSENKPTYRYVYVVWSNSTCIKGFINTGITELK